MAKGCFCVAEIMGIGRKGDICSILLQFGPSENPHNVRDAAAISFSNKRCIAESVQKVHTGCFKSFKNLCSILKSPCLSG